jgi:hypothetical protein
MHVQFELIIATTDHEHIVNYMAAESQLGARGGSTRAKLRGLASSGPQCSDDIIPFAGFDAQDGDARQAGW